MELDFIRHCSSVEKGAGGGSLTPPTGAWLLRWDNVVGEEAEQMDSASANVRIFIYCIVYIPRPMSDIART